MISIVLASAVRLDRDSLERCLRGVPGFRVRDAVSSADAIVDSARECRPDVALVDMRLAGALSAIARIDGRLTETHVVATAVPESEAEIVRCAEAGACGFVSVNATFEDLITSITAAGAGELRCSPRIAALLFRRLALKSKGLSPEALPLTLRELEIGRLLEQGSSNKEIAAALGIEVSTAKNHVHNLLAKLKVRRRGEAVARLRYQAAPASLHPRIPQRS